MHSLRGQLVFFWALLFGACLALAGMMFTLYQGSAGAQIAAARSATEMSCQNITTRYAKSLTSPSTQAPRIDLLQVLLQLVLIEAPQVEGGVWQTGKGHLAYAYPTYEGSGVKRDLPEAEQPLITEMAARAVRTRETQTDVVRGSREALIVTACPLPAANDDLSAWTMTRSHGGALAAQDSLRAGLAGLLVLVVVSGLWLGAILLRGLRHVQRLEARLVQAHADGGAMPELTRTGVSELDRIVDSFNHYRLRFDEARAHLRAAAQQRHRDQRLAALGRMTAGIAHEIRNPIATMRLKAENALHAAPERQGPALQAIVGQIDRLDGLVQSLLALVQPITLATDVVVMERWLAERVAGVAARAEASQVQVTVVPGAPATAVFDPVHLARAVDNLLDNAVRHTPAGGTVRLSAHVAPLPAAPSAGQPSLLSAHAGDARTLVIRVDDTGPGIPESLQPSLFEPFATGRADGTGLGLALTREVALAHGGDVHHVPLDPGARFDLEIPWRAS